MFSVSGRIFKFAVNKIWYPPIHSKILHLQLGDLQHKADPTAPADTPGGRRSLKLIRQDQGSGVAEKLCATPSHPKVLSPQ